MKSPFTYISPFEVSCFSTDGSIRKLTLYPEAREIFQWCVINKVKLTICSRSPQKSFVEEILKAFKIWDWFEFPQIYYKRKTYHFRNLSECTGLNLSRFLFFDDEESNVETCRSAGVPSFQVQKGVGLNWQTFIQGLQYFHEVQLNIITPDESAMNSGAEDEEEYEPNASRHDSQQFNVKNIVEEDNNKGRQEQFNEHQELGTSSAAPQPAQLGLNATVTSRPKFLQGLSLVL